jgi:hypothetical protein
MMEEIVEKFRLFPVDKVKKGLDLSDEEEEKMKSFINDFCTLVSNMSNHNYFLYDIKIIFTAIMICSLKGPNSLFDLSEVVSNYMMPKGEDVKLATTILDKIKGNYSKIDIDGIKEVISQNLGKYKEKEEDPNLTNLRDEDGNRMTIEQVEALYNESK